MVDMEDLIKFYREQFQGSKEADSGAEVLGTDIVRCANCTTPITGIMTTFGPAWIHWNTAGEVRYYGCHFATRDYDAEVTTYAAHPEHVDAATFYAEHPEHALGAIIRTPRPVTIPELQKCVQDENCPECGAEIVWATINIPLDGSRIAYASGLCNECYEPVKQWLGCL
jgi:hypothetical protein